ncbi:zeta toxin family protein [Synoicihabitans lomoniglobus]|uniref:Zeta toxin family protein n=1 Tax=Synoicihabitans lomoniglobus TaxID=2909285 RepID=A0AAF0CSL6_9BACT|nr:zeta toxin family protein [Opitutaceae bacterium LMO-M01]WED67297.1 zeta toxin family protein [Opitutaceae bacterium LMO-M01]
MPAKSRPLPALTVLAGVNGAGKSSIGGEALQAAGAVYFNPDEYAHQLRSRETLSQVKANAIAWAYGKAKLEAAIAQGTDFTFESTLGGKTITNLLTRAAGKSHQIDIWFVGLKSVDLHLQRVASRVAQGGHPIPEAAIRQRWIGSHENIIRLIPHVTTLRLFDNSPEVAEGEIPDPTLLLSIQNGQLAYPGPDVLSTTPQWAKPIVAAAYRHFGLMG